MRGQQTSSVRPATVGERQQEAAAAASDKSAPLCERRCVCDTRQRAFTSNYILKPPQKAQPMSPSARDSIKQQQQQQQQARRQQQKQQQQQTKKKKTRQPQQQQHKRRRQSFSCGQRRGAFWPPFARLQVSFKQPLASFFLAAFLLLLASAFQSSNSLAIAEKSQANAVSQQQQQLAIGNANQLLDQQAAERRRRSLLRGRLESAAELAECARLSALWASFRASYPRLAKHLLAEEPRQQVKRQDAKAVARLLEGAERLLRASESNQLQHQARGSWLARVLANPLYAKIIQHFQDNSNNIDNKKQTDSSAQEKASLVANKGRSEQDERFYGRVAKYPHELSLSNAQNGAQESSPAKTLDKLRFLSQHQRQLLGEEENEVRSNKVSKKIDAARMSNKVLEENNGGGDGDATVERHQEAQRNANKPDKELDSARHKYVYGNVLYRPNENAIDETSERHNSLDSLRQLNAGVGGGVDGGGRVSGSLRRARNALEPIDEQQLFSGTTVERKRSDRDGQEEEPQELSNKELLEVKLSVLNWLLEKNWASQRAAKGWQPPTEPGERELLGQLGVSFGESAANDELPAQFSRAGGAGGGDAKKTNADEEFPGVWHSKPAERVGISYERASKVGGQPVVITLTTARPGDLFVVE